MLPKIATEAKLCESHLKICSFCPTVQNTVVLCLKTESNQSFQDQEANRVQNQEEQSSGNSNRQTEIYRF